MDRRDYLRLVGGAGMAATAGCSGGSNEDSTSTIQDSDGDGVIDSEDYAPHDPSVQEKGDLVSSTTTAPSTSVSDPITSTTVGSSPDSATAENQIDAELEDIRGIVPSYFEWYSTAEAKLAFDTGHLEFPTDHMDVFVEASEYPRGNTLDYYRSDTVPTSGTGITRFETSYDLSIPDDTPFSLIVTLIRPGTELEKITSEDVITLAETDRLIIEDGRLKKSPHPDAKGSLETSSYERAVGEGVYGISVSGDSDGTFSDSVDFGLYTYKSVYVRQSNKPFDPLMTTIRNAIQEGIAGELAQIMYDSAEEAGYSSDNEKVDYAIRATQQLPYVSDVGSGYDAYNKYPVETLVEAGGDCEDTAILLGAALTAEPFNYGMVLLEIPADDPDHVALGIKGAEDLPGHYYTYEGERYYYIETTGEGWSIGEMPDEYQNTAATIKPIRV